MFSRVFPSGHYTINVKLDPSLHSDVGMETLNSSTILVNPVTLSQPTNIVAAEIGHELKHVNDFLRGRLDAYSPSSVEAASEVRAYTWEIQHAQEFNLSPGFRLFLDQEICHYQEVEAQP